MTGVSGSGKTTVCENTIARTAARGYSVGGILTRPRLAQPGERGLDVEDVRRGDRRKLAETVETTDGPIIGPWHFHRSGLAWGDAILATALPCDLLVVDELGPLELLRGDGWANAVPVVRDGRFRLALAVVRPAFVELFHGLVRGMRVMTVTVTAGNRDGLPAELVARLDSAS